MLETLNGHRWAMNFSVSLLALTTQTLSLTHTQMRTQTHTYIQINMYIHEEVGEIRKRDGSTSIVVIIWRMGMK